MEASVDFKILVIVTRLYKEDLGFRSAFVQQVSERSSAGLLVVMAYVY